MPPLAFKAPAAAPASYDWTGFYVGGHLGDAWGNSRLDRERRRGAGDLRLVRYVSAVRPFRRNGKLLRGRSERATTTGSPNRLVLGAAVDASFPAFPDRDRHLDRRQLDVHFAGHWRRELWRDGAVLRHRARSRRLCARRLARSMRPADWPGPMTRLSLTQLGNGATEARFLWRFGWAAGAGVEVPDRAALDGEARISVHRLRHSSVTFRRRAADQRRFVPARVARGRELSVRQRCSSGEFELDRGRRAGCGSGQFSRPGHVRLARLSADPIALCGRQQPAR